jgi:hypothetical protein
MRHEGSIVDVPKLVAVAAWITARSEVNIMRQRDICIKL